MINNICENIKSTKPNTVLKPTLSTAYTTVDGGQNTIVEANEVAHNTNNNNSNGGGILQTTYGHGIWYSEIIDAANNTNINAIVHKQQYYDNASTSCNNNNKENAVNRNVWLSAGGSDVSKEQRKQQQQQQRTSCTQVNNECDVIIVDIEDEDESNNEAKRQNQQHYHQHQHQHQQPIYSLPPKFFMNANIKFPQKHPTICDSERGTAKNNITCSASNNAPYTANDGPVKNIASVDVNDDDEVEEEDDSLASMETLSDNVSIWIDGEKHWVTGVDANTTCSELIWALVTYQNGQQQPPSQRQTQGEQQHAFASAINEENIASAVFSKANSNLYEKHEVEKQQQHLPKLYDKNVIEFNLRMCTNEGSSNMCTDRQPNMQNTAKTNNNSTYTTSANTNTNAANPNTANPINQSMPINTKENCKITQNSTLTAITAAAATPPTATSLSSSATPIISSLAPVSDTTPPPLTLLPLTLPAGIATVSQLATEYVIVKQYHHCEEYLDGSTKVFDVLPPRNGSNKKECELLLRHLGPAPAVYINNTTPQLSSLISTDKDSGMGSPVGSARSAKFRRRKHKSSQWLAQANTLHPKLSRCSANERLMKIILAQDETIQRQLSLLREKERQITKIEEEKHRKRERELGKNYLLETYLNGLDEAECEPEIQDTEEIFIDEPYQRGPATTTASPAPNPRTATTSSANMLAAGTIREKIPSATEALNMMAKHKLKEKEVKKEKKKKRHKEKQTKDEEFQAKDFNLKANKNKEKVDKQQHHHHELKTIEDNIVKDNDNEQEIEMQILWLEKIYTLNKQLQKEEELAAKLHAKVRKHQLKKAQQTQQEVQLEIDKLDNNLALQCGDIRKVEANLMQTNEQLQKKLLILERLSMDYLQHQEEKPVHKEQRDTKFQICTANRTDDNNTLLTNQQKSLDTRKLSLNNIKSKEEVIKLEKIIAKSSADLQPANSELKEFKQEDNNMSQNVTNKPTRQTTKATFLQTNQIFPKVNSVPTNHSVRLTTANTHQPQMQHFHHNNHQPEQAIPSATPISATAQTSYMEEISPNAAVPTSCMFIDKNMLSSLHVQNAKTIKKQMFHTQTTATATATATTSASMTSSQLSPPTQPPLTAPTTSSVPKRQLQHTLQQYMPMASTFLTSRPQNSHQILTQPTNIVKVQQPSAASSSCPLQLQSTKSSTLAPAPAPAPAPITASTLLAQHPPTSTSPSPSIMAMNTVDISQLGTLV